jgi:hypothetical protein
MRLYYNLPKAAEVVQRALVLTTGQGRSAPVTTLRDEIAMYQMGLPHREAEYNRLPTVLWVFTSERRRNSSL